MNVAPVNMNVLVLLAALAETTTVIPV